MNLGDGALARSLLSSTKVRARAHELLGVGESGGLVAWRVDAARLPNIVDYVVDTIRSRYPMLDIPFHARWRHFNLGGVDRGNIYRLPNPAFPDRATQSRAAFDLAIVSVLLDAGAGPAWRYRSANGLNHERSEGLAIASIDMFEAGAFSNQRETPARADARRLMTVDVPALRSGFQASEANPLVGLEGRVGLLNALGRAVSERPDIFAREDTPRPGGLFDHFVALARDRRLAAPLILEVLLDGLGAIWPSRLSLGGVALGDTWRHPALVRADATNGLVPFHKLSQWLAYSLIEPLQWAGIEVTDIDGLTGLPEYRNGGLFVDLGAIVLKDPADATRAHAPDSPLIVEWRALTVALLDRVAGLMRNRLSMDARGLPLACILEGGTWAAGRRIARELRPDGAPPIHLASDGTVF
jgi:hypothetical protein